VTSIHPTAIVAPGARIGQGVEIGPWSTVGPDVEIADGVKLISHVVVDGHTRIGAGSTLYPFCTLGLAPQDLKYKGDPTRVEVGERTLIREHVTVHRGTTEGGGVTRVGSDCMIMAVVHIAHDCQIGNGVIIANNVVMGGHVHIDDNAVIGGSSALHQFVHIGRAAMVGGVTGIGGDLVPFGMAIGNRGWLAGLNVIGLRRRGYNREQIMTVRRAFKEMFWSPGVFAERVEAVRARLGHDPLIAEILAFMASPGRRGLLAAGAQEAEEGDG
jgi:UDP-N-acetylglucosamine acyltransferase